MKKDIQQIQISLDKLRAFAEAYPQIEETPHYILASDELPRVVIYCADGNRDSILAGIGKLLGPEGWITEDGNEKTINFTTMEKVFTLHWVKTVDGVLVRLTDAQILERKPTGVPVPPSKFPLMIHDVFNPGEPETESPITDEAPEHDPDEIVF